MIKNNSKLESALAMVYKHLGCGDNSCMYKKPYGMATNGGCSCPGERGTPMPRVASLALANLARTVQGFLESSAPKPCKFKVGDRVRFTKNWRGDMGHGGDTGIVTGIEPEDDIDLSMILVRWDGEPDDVPERMCQEELELLTSPAGP